MSSKDWRSTPVIFHDSRTKIPEKKGKGAKKNQRNELKNIDVRDMSSFLTTPVTKGSTVECYIMRKKEGFMAKYPRYEVRLDDRMDRNNLFLMVGKRQSNNKTSNYWISMDRMHLDPSSKSYLGKVRSNFVGTEFIIYDNGINPSKLTGRSDDRAVRLEMGAILYGANLGANHPREMTVVLPKGEPQGETVSSSGTVGILQRYAKDKKGIFELHQKKPQWNEKLKAFTLNFHGRVTKASVKNFQLVYKGEFEGDEAYSSRESGKVSLQFGKVDADKFTMDIRWPLSPFQAFAICLSSFDSKLFCEG